MARAAAPAAAGRLPRSQTARGQKSRTQASRRRPQRGGSSRTRSQARGSLLPESVVAFAGQRARQIGGFALIVAAILLSVALASYSATDPSWNRVGSTGPTENLLGALGSYPADLFIQTVGGAGYVFALVPLVWGWRLMRAKPVGPLWLRVAGLVLATPLVAAAMAPFAAPTSWVGVYSLGGALGAMLMGWLAEQAMPHIGWISPQLFSAGLAVPTLILLLVALGLGLGEWGRIIALVARHIGTYLAWAARYGWWLLQLGWYYGSIGAVWTWHYLSRGCSAVFRAGRSVARRRKDRTPPSAKRAPTDELDPIEIPAEQPQRAADPEVVPPNASTAIAAKPVRVQTAPRGPAPPSRKQRSDSRQSRLELAPSPDYELPPIDILGVPDPTKRPAQVSEQAMQENAAALETVLGDFGVRGSIVRVNPGPVVTLYELEPAPGTKSSRVIGLADDIARSMSAVSVRVAVVPGRNVIGIEMPNQTREIVLLREIIENQVYERAAGKLTLVLGKEIGGQPVLADLARMPHLLVAGTTGSGKSVAVNTMILSLLYRLPPENCRLIMIDPKMLELSIYDGIPHLLSPVVTDPKQAVVALKWAVREMEDRYRAMSKMGVRNIEGYNQRLREAKRTGENLMRRVQTGFDPDTGKPVFEDQPLDLTELPYIVVVVDEMADLMMVAGKEIEGAIQRLAQMARAAGIHLIMATQRPSVDVITGTIKANFPTRISFQVTSKIDSRTILGEGGAEQLLGQGDMLYMAGGGRITRVHGPFVSDNEVEAVVNHLRAQGEPEYNDSVLEDEEESAAIDAMLNGGAPAGGGNSGDELYDRAVALVAHERKASTSFVQRHLQIGYNRAARIIDQMEAEGVVSKANHVGKREVLVGDHAGD
ncbi:MAG: DNA translocase FtsK 4TM domain-containing protein [Pseudomonadota bacterium]